MSLGDARYCVFDAYGTLLDLNSALHGADRALTPDQSEALGALWRRKQLEYTWLRSLSGVFEDFWRVTGEALDHAMIACRIDDPALRAELMQNYLGLSSFPDAEPALAALKAGGKRNAVLSNGSQTMLTSAVTQGPCGVYFEAVLSADRAQVFKPHPDVYRLALDALGGAAPREVAFFSSNGWDVAGAATFGFNAVWVNRAGAPPERLPHGPVATIASLAEAPTLFGL